MINSYGSNDELLIALKNSNEDTSSIELIGIPQPEHTADFTSRINSEDGLLLILTSVNGLPISFFKNLIGSGVQPTNIITAIV